MHHKSYGSNSGEIEDMNKTQRNSSYSQPSAVDTPVFF